MSAVTGDPIEYSGNDTREAHRGMGITDNEFDVVAEHLDTVLAENEVPMIADERIQVGIQPTVIDFGFVVPIQFVLDSEPVLLVLASNNVQHVTLESCKVVYRRTKPS